VCKLWSSKMAIADTSTDCILTSMRIISGCPISTKQTSSSSWLIRRVVSYLHTS
jgi:hypothetical protein